MCHSSGPLRLSWVQSSVEHVVSEGYTELEGGSVHDSVFFPHGHGCCVQVHILVTIPGPVRVTCCVCQLSHKVASVLNDFPVWTSQPLVTVLFPLAALQVCTGAQGSQKLGLGYRVRSLGR